MTYPNKQVPCLQIYAVLMNAIQVQIILSTMKCDTGETGLLRLGDLQQINV